MLKKKNKPFQTIPFLSYYMVYSYDIHKLYQIFASVIYFKWANQNIFLWSFKSNIGYKCVRLTELLHLLEESSAKISALEK